MKLKIFTIITAILIMSNNIFAEFALDLSGKLGFVGSFTDLTESVPEGRGDINLQLGYHFPIRERLKGIELLFDTGLNVGTLSTRKDINNINQMGIIGINTGLALKFVLTPIFLPNAINTNQYFVYGLSAGAKFIPFIGGISEKPSQVPISLYVNLSAERRIYTYDNRALSVGVNIFYEYMFFNKNDAPKLFAGRNISQHHSIGALLSIGFHFGKN